MAKTKGELGEPVDFTPGKGGPRVRHTGMFKPGQSGNPSGYPGKTPEQRTFDQLAKEKSLKALEFLDSTIDNEDAPWKERMNAAIAIVSHGQGLPVARTLNATLEAKPAQQMERGELFSRVQKYFQGEFTDELRTEQQ